MFVIKISENIMDEMNNIINPKDYGLTQRDNLIQHQPHRFSLVIHRKSRIVMADGKRIVDKIGLIRRTDPKAKVSLRTDAPICSKTRNVLKDMGIDVVEEYTT